MPQRGRTTFMLVPANGPFSADAVGNPVTKTLTIDGPIPPVIGRQPVGMVTIAIQRVQPTLVVNKDVGTDACPTPPSAAQLNVIAVRGADLTAALEPRTIIGSSEIGWSPPVGEQMRVGVQASQGRLANCPTVAGGQDTRAGVVFNTCDVTAAYGSNAPVLQACRP